MFINFPFLLSPNLYQLSLPFVSESLSTFPSPCLRIFINFPFPLSPNLYQLSLPLLLFRFFLVVCTQALSGRLGLMQPNLSFKAGVLFYLYAVVQVSVCTRSKGTQATPFSAGGRYLRWCHELSLSLSPPTLLSLCIYSLL